MAARKKTGKKRPRYWNDHLKGAALFKGTVVQVARRAGVSLSTVSRLRAAHVKEQLAAREPVRPPMAPIEQWKNVSGVPIFETVVHLRELSPLELLDRIAARLKSCRADLAELAKHGYK